MKEKLALFINTHDCDSAKNLITLGLIKEAEEQIGVSFGEELSNYLLTYGYLGFQELEFYGMNANQGLESDLVKQTVYLHNFFPMTKDYIAFQNSKDSMYVLIDSTDQIYECDLILKTIQNMNMNLFEYILNRFEEIA